MFSARDKNGKILHLLKESSLSKGDYFCPECGGPVRLKKGKIMQPHFAHIRLSDCHYSVENESKEHLNLKAALFRWANQTTRVDVEVFLPDLQQVADVLVDERLALEVQCSSLYQDRLWERSQRYRQAGYQVLWLLGKKLWLRQTLTPLQKQFLYFSQNMGFHIWELDEERKMLRLKYLIHEDLHGQLQYKEKEFPFEKGKLLDILRLPFSKQEMSSFFVKSDPDICHYIRQQLYYRNPKWMKIQASYYQKEKNLLTMSREEFYPQVRPIRSDQPLCQISQDLSAYYENFQRYYHHSPDKKYQIVYPPAFYASLDQSC